MDIFILVVLLVILYFFYFKIRNLSKSVLISNEEKKKQFKKYIIIMLVIFVISVIVTIIFKILYMNNGVDWEQIVFIFGLLNSLAYLGNLSSAVSEYRKCNSVGDNVSTSEVIEGKIDEEKVEK